MKRARGLVALLTDVVNHGAEAVERIHLETAARPFEILEQLPGIGAPASLVHAVHDVVVRGTYGSVRVIAKAVGTVADAALEASTKKPPT